MSCPLCRLRKAKRSCPVVGEDICPVCCGTKRIVEFACPDNCVFLESSQRHPAAIVRRQQEHDLGLLMLALGRVSEPQLQLFFLLHTFISRFKPDGSASLDDAAVGEAAGALAASFETASRGVLYEQQSPSVVGERLRRDLKVFLARVGRDAGSRFEREAAIVLRGIERGARHEMAGIGPGRRDYLSLVARILRERPPPAIDSGTIILP